MTTPPSRSLTLRALLAFPLLLGAAALPACDHGEGTLFTVKEYPAADPADDPLFVFQTKSTAYNDKAGTSWPVYVEVHGTHGKEFLPRGVQNKGVEFRMYTFTGPPFPDDVINLHPQKRAVVGLADTSSIQLGSAMFPDPAGGPDKMAQFINAGVSAFSLQIVSGNDVVDVRVGDVTVQLTMDQLQGMANMIQKICTQRK